MTRLRSTLALTVVLVFQSVQAQRVTLITPEEASLPPPAPRANRGVTRGPEVKLISPRLGEVVGTPFRFQISFKPRGGVPIDPSSVEIRYLRKQAVDMTPRLRSFIKSDGVLVDEAVIPPGEHDIEVLVKDARDRVAVETLQLLVK